MSLVGCAEDPWLNALLRQDRRRVVVLDDDPTGTQTVSDVDVILDPDGARFDHFFRSPVRALYVLTNSRAMPRDEATGHLRAIVREIDGAAGRAGEKWMPVLRGDSTLRGHVFDEVDALSSANAVTLFVPAFPEGGRVTLAGAQWVEVDGRRANAADTEFARDPTFGYRSRDLISWVAEVGGGRAATMVALGTLRESGPEAVAAALEAAEPGTVVIPEAETADDLRCVAAGLLTAEARGLSVVVRSASSFAAVRAGLLGRSLERVPGPAPKRILVACGSYTAASTAQLAVLASRGWPIHELTSEVSDDHLVDGARADLERFGLAIVTTPRAQADDGSLGSGALMMERLTSVIGQLRNDIDAVIAKGGITSAAAAIRLGASVARVEGQLAPGIALWLLRLDGGGRLPYVVIPGNVGGPDAIASIHDRLRDRACDPAGGL